MLGSLFALDVVAQHLPGGALLSGALGLLGLRGALLGLQAQRVVELLRAVVLGPLLHLGLGDELRLILALPALPEVLAPGLPEQAGQLPACGRLFLRPQLALLPVQLELAGAGRAAGLLGGQ